MRQLRLPTELNAQDSADMGNAECGVRSDKVFHPASRMPHPARERAQSTMEYAIFVAVVAAALSAMTVYVRRSIQANLKTLENQINAEAARPSG